MCNLAEPLVDLTGIDNVATSLDEDARREDVEGVGTSTLDYRAG